MLPVKSSAPDMEIETHLEDRGKLSDFWKEGALILFFYPKDDTRICTKQACTLQTSLGEFGTFGARVLGCSLGSRASHQSFAQKNGITFPLILDPKGRLARAYEAFRPLIRIPKRITYVIDGNGVILGAVHQEFNVQAHLDMIRSVLSQPVDQKGS